MIYNALLVFLGGGIGSALRYGSWLLFGSETSTLPWSTFLVNILGSLVVGTITGMFSQDSQHWNRDVMLFVGVGMCGGFTTFSAFSLEISTLIEQNNTLFALGYALLSVIVGVVATFVGVVIGRIVL